MRIRYKESFKSRLNRQLKYIAKHSPANARKFRDALRLRIESIDVFGLTKYQATPVDEPH